MKKVHSNRVYEIFDKINFEYLDNNFVELFNLDLLPSVLIPNMGTSIEANMVLDLFTSRIREDNLQNRYGGRYSEFRRRSKGDDGYLEDKYIKYCYDLIYEFVKNHPEHSSLLLSD